MYKKNDTDKESNSPNYNIFQNLFKKTLLENYRKSCWVLHQIKREA